jgi:hypothetical protein
MSDEAKEQPISSHNNMKDIRAKLQDSVHDAGLLLQNLALLDEYLANDDKEGTHESQTLLLGVLVKIVRLHSRHGDVQRHAFKLLKRLCSGNPPNQRVFVREKGVSAVVSAMRSHPEDVDVQAGACEVLKCTCIPLTHEAEDSKAQKRSIAAAVVTAMKALGSHEKTVGLGMQVLRAVTPEPQSMRDFEAGRDVFDKELQANILEVVMHAMRAYPRNSAIQSDGCGLCYYFATYLEENCDILWNSDATRLFLAAMECIIQDDALDKSDSKVQEALVIACRIMFIIHPQVPEDTPARDQPGLSIIARAMKVCRENSNLQEAGISALSKATHENVKNTEYVGGSEALFLIVDGIRRGMADRRFQPIAFRTLINLTNGSAAASTVKSLLEPKHFSILLEAARLYISDAVIQATAARLFGKMAALSVQDRLEMFKTKCIAVLVDAIKAQNNGIVPAYMPESEEEDLQHQVCGAFWNLLQGVPRDLQTQARKEGVVDAIVMAMSQAQGRWVVHAVACHAMNCIFVYHPENVEAAGSKAMRSAVASILACTEHAPIAPQSIHAMLKFAGLGVLHTIIQIACNMPHFRKYQDELGQCRGVKALAICHRAQEMEFPNNIPPPSEGVTNTRQLPLEETMWITTVASASMCFRMIAQAHRENQDRCAQEGVVNHALQLMREYHHDQGRCQGISKESCELLRVLSAGHKRNARAIIAHPALDEVLQILQNNSVKRDLTELVEDLMSRYPGQPENDADSTDDVSSRPAKAVEVCAVCGKSAKDISKGEMLQCGACTVKPRYCRKECQRADWPSHRSVCRANKKV